MNRLLPSTGEFRSSKHPGACSFQTIVLLYFNMYYFQYCLFVAYGNLEIYKNFMQLCAVSDKQKY